MTATEESVGANSFRPAELEIDSEGCGHLVGSRCCGCGAHFFPVRQACSGCLSTDLETKHLSSEGILYTYSVVRQSTPDFEVPYMLGYIDLPEGVRVMGQMTGYELDIPLGTPMVLEVVPFGTDEDDAELLGYRFVPAATTGAGQKEATND
ncbi:MAG: hypothetical protein GY724_29340 [Actinomycetia bacterium]|nr:hypothetical protein [Actinomycetes bacterium]MCP4224421.1 hypothetical protein [Actinomycetes bacterium]MCP5031676.1 hypothetical protein [Actinomycetes bacterium]